MGTLGNQDVVEVCATAGAFAALKGDGSVVCWGDPAMGGRCEFELTDSSRCNRGKGCLEPFVEYPV